MSTVADALARLQAGNGRYRAGTLSRSQNFTSDQRAALAAGQHPFAVVIGCADSRVPVSLVFDQAPGDLFVIRVAGNVITPAVVGSVEFAVGQLGVPLVVVMGHSDCGAVQAALDPQTAPAEMGMPNLQALLEQIRPALHNLPDSAPEVRIAAAVRANIHAAAAALTKHSPLLAKAVAEGTTQILPAEYDLHDGRVTLLEG
jgi:carbonic anhydrase